MLNIFHATVHLGAGIRRQNAIQEIKNGLNLKNLEMLCERAENIKNKKYDFITSRAVAALKILVSYAIPLLAENGYFIAYKSVKAQEEIDDAKIVLRKYNAKVTDIITYELPLEENYTRNLVIIRKN